MLNRDIAFRNIAFRNILNEQIVKYQRVNKSIDVSGNNP